jgi:hypothetical protein
VLVRRRRLVIVGDFTDRGEGDKGESLELDQMNSDQLLAQLRWFCASVRLTEVSGEPAIEADGVRLSFLEAESLARGDTSLADIASARKRMQISQSL